MIAQQQLNTRGDGVHDIDVWKQRIGGALIPLFFVGALLRRQNFNELADLRRA